MIRTAIFGLCLTAAIWPGPSESQPFSDSMADCAGLLMASGRLIETPERKVFVEQTAAVWMDAAIAQSKAEGRADAEAVVVARAETTMQDWAEKGRLMPFTQDYRDWIAYCRKFGRAQGLF